MLSELDEISPQVHESAFVSETAHLIGDVRVGPYSSIWPGVVIRADSGKIVIGERSNVQDNSVLHADDDASIGDDVTLGHGVICHAKRIGDGSLIGNGSVLNDGVEVGPRCLVAAGSVITENTVIEPEMLVRGIPGRPIGKIRKRHADLQKLAANSYVARIERYKRSRAKGIPI